jgi:hypothetical protein
MTDDTTEDSETATGQVKMGVLRSSRGELGSAHILVQGDDPLCGVLQSEDTEIDVITPAEARELQPDICENCMTLGKKIGAVVT